MTIAILTLKESNATHRPMKAMIPIGLAVIAAMTGGCVTVAAPEEPIVIELNISVQQTVDVNLQQDVEELIENNPELFPE